MIEFVNDTQSYLFQSMCVLLKEPSEIPGSFSVNNFIKNGEFEYANPSDELIYIHPQGGKKDWVENRGINPPATVWEEM